MVWIFMTSSETTTHSQLRVFGLDVLTYQAMYPAANWSFATEILQSCQPEEGPLRATLSESLVHVLRPLDFRFGGILALGLSISSTALTFCIGQGLVDMSLTQGTAPDPSDNPKKRARNHNVRCPTFENSLERFIMFVSSASQENPHVANATVESNVVEAVHIGLVWSARYERPRVGLDSRGCRQRHWRFMERCGRTLANDADEERLRGMFPRPVVTTGHDFFNEKGATLQTRDPEARRLNAVYSASGRLPTPLFGHRG
ncbi:hypothetical protein BC835DRAFT_219742 [Cytidiella melzeri]|nr:hypothetical protein BC835DRAFT_219742 [Cytidiella melzeri]